MKHAATQKPVYKITAFSICWAQSLVLSLIPVFFTVSTLPAQPINQKTLFSSDTLLRITITADFKKIKKSKDERVYQPATISFHMPQNEITESINIRSRGVQRRLICKTPPLMLNFAGAKNKVIKKLGTLKLVSGCNIDSYFEQLVLKEYLVYKMYNLLSSQSFRVRLVHVNYNQSENKPGSWKQYSFLIEDTDDMAARNDCMELNQKISTDQINRKQMTLLAVFQYMIGNHDWSVPGLKNIKLIVAKELANSRPLAVPYDFDYSGIVNARYAIPADHYNIDSVTERIYRGVRRNIEEIHIALDTLKFYKQAFKTLIADFNLLTTNHKQEMISYLNEFYQLIEDNRKLKEIFIDNVRNE